MKKSITSDKALKATAKYFFKEIDGFRALTGTTQAIDLIGGGVKTNALPEQAWAVVNHRIATERSVFLKIVLFYVLTITMNVVSKYSSLGELKSRDTTLLQSLATKFNLSYTAFGVSQSDKDAPAYGTLTLSEPFHPGLEPAPVTPIDEEPYQLLSGTIRAAYNAHRSLEGDNISVAPSIMSANTGKLDRSCVDLDSDGPPFRYEVLLGSDKAYLSLQPLQQRQW